MFHVAQHMFRHHVVIVVSTLSRVTLVLSSTYVTLYLTLIGNQWLGLNHWVQDRGHVRYMPFVCRCPLL